MGFDKVFLFVCFLPFRATPAAYAGSQARGQIRAIADSLHHSHSNMGSNCICDLYHSSWQQRILNPLNKARDKTCKFMVPSQIC